MFAGILTLVGVAPAICSLQVFAVLGATTSLVVGVGVDWEAVFCAVSGIENSQFVQVRGPYLSMPGSSYLYLHSFMDLPSLEYIN